MLDSNLDTKRVDENNIALRDIVPPKNSGLFIVEGWSD
eukprot:CAMPEP_0118678116 /NCGR_PEP_ID=MMETSP0800-20121206/3022_1 /TAXON_ID=210618 ORGANISM="Striatella unipunctata, Strain CCMP2910" /NCGR_SAMPLE_ID=MMETSP0800 /ASSEMBLY_ACC=CAM_ASM_000638 /LENGTH=37 /DNA_ID= /DNA_START= /DNA_END= /DNA_ORIENTATION=